MNLGQTCGSPSRAKKDYRLAGVDARTLDILAGCAKRPQASYQITGKPEIENTASTTLVNFWFAD